MSDLISIEDPRDNIQNVSNQELEELILGLDFGTTNSVAYILKAKNDSLDNLDFTIDPSDLERILVIDKDHSSGLFPSVINISDKEITIGNIAVNNVPHNNNLNIKSIKRLIGKTYEEIISSHPMYKNNLRHSDKLNMPLFVHNNKEYTIPTLCSYIISHIKSVAENIIKQSLTKIVITVPAYFDDVERSIIKLAAQTSGLEPIRIINEPTSAALAYGLDNSVEGHYIVYDLGGGTFDASLLHMEKGIFKVIATIGDTQLGGDDIDKAILDFWKKDQTLINLSSARKAKEELIGISPEELENISSPIVGKTIFLTKKLLQDSNLKKSDLKGIILVGGSTRLLGLKQKIIDNFGDNIFDNLDPDRVVALGAALQAYQLKTAKGNLLLDVIPLSIGIELMGGIVEKIIERNSSIPVSIEQEFTTFENFQTGIKIHLVQGERELAKDCRSLAFFEIKNLTPAPAGMVKIVVRLQIDADGLLTVTAYEKNEHNSEDHKNIKQIEVRPSFGLDFNKMQIMLMEAMTHAQEDMSNKFLQETIIEAKKSINSTKFLIEKNRDTVNAFDNNLEFTANQKIKIVENFIDTSRDRVAIQEATEDLEKTMLPFVEYIMNYHLEETIKNKKLEDFQRL